MAELSSRRRRRSSPKMSTPPGRPCTIDKPLCSPGRIRSRSGSVNGDGNGPMTLIRARSRWPRSTTSRRTKTMWTWFTRPSSRSTSRLARASSSRPPRKYCSGPPCFPTNKCPVSSKIWSAQERLWIQRTLLEVVREVNKNAKDWNSAIIRQIEAIQVGNPDAQDQRSLAKNEELQESETILAPGETPARVHRLGLALRNPGCRRWAG